MCTLDSGDGVSLEAAGLNGRWEAEILPASVALLWLLGRGPQETSPERQQNKAISGVLQGFLPVVCSAQGHSVP